MGTDSYSNTNVEAWLRGEVAFLYDASEQDTDLILASVHPTTSLFRLFELPKTIPERRDQIAMAICLQLEDALIGERESVNNVDVPIDEIAAFIRANLDLFIAADQRSGFGISFEQVIVPYVASSE